MRPRAPLDWRFVSDVEGARWPAVSAPDAAATLALLDQLEQSQWLPPESLRALQLAQMERLLRHAWRTVAFYREHWRGRYEEGRPLSMDGVARLPTIGRRDLQERFEAFKSEAVPAQHAPFHTTRTSGSSGAPVRVVKSGVTRRFWNALTLRDHAWHARDLDAKLAAIRHGAAPGSHPGWGAATDGVVETGPSVVLPIATDPEEQLDWLRRESPAYLLSYPSNLAELARVSLERSLSFPALREVRSIGELLAPELRARIREAWGVPVVDAYSADEVGYLALQCPRHEHYHAQAENLLVEILDDEGRACAPGEVGRVVVTDLHNFAMPLVRYDIGDYAEAGPACDCGRGLPVLSRVVGRVRNMLVTRDGRRHWPSFGLRILEGVSKLRQYRTVQKSYERLELQLVVSAPLEPGEAEAVLRQVRSRLPEGFEVELRYVEALPRSAGGKFEEFVSEVAAPVSGASR